ncbi:MAG: hypothetical protein KF791_02300 [Verrucomicrobiae bacterium]|nr:hypothetical protein [Verrucomicrobiae bacterium]
MNLSLRPRLPWILACFLALVCVAGRAAESNLFPLDTRLGITLTGQVVDGTAPGGPYRPLGGATVRAGGVSGTTGGDGRFALKASLAGAAELTVGAGGVMPVILGLGPAESGESSRDMGIIRLTRLTDGPVVESLRLEPHYFFLHGRGLATEAIVRVNWQGHEPDFVRLVVGGREVARRPGGTSGMVRIPLAVDAVFTGSLREQSLEAVAVTKQGLTSRPVRVSVLVFPWPAFLEALRSFSEQTPTRSIVLDFNLISREQVVTLPVLGRFGFEFGLGMSFDYALTDGSWEAAVGMQTSASPGRRGRRPTIPGFSGYERPRLYIGNREFEAAVFAQAAGVATPQRGIQVEEIRGGFSLGARLEVGRYGLLDLVGPGATTAVRHALGEEFVRGFSVRIDALPEITGSAIFAPRWPLDLKGGEAELKLGLEAIYAPRVGKAEASVYVGGSAAGTFGLPQPIFREVNFKSYVGLTANVWVFNTKAEYVFLNYSYPARRLSLAALPVEGGYILPAAANAGGGWTLVERAWREAGDEYFLAVPAASGQPLTGVARAGAGSGALDTFARMSVTPSPGAVYSPSPAVGLARRLASDSNLPAQVELPLLGNVFADAEPALAARGTELMLLYVRDTGAENPVQFTGIAFTRFDGENWSAPAALAADPRAQFNPQVVFDGNGDGLAVFERVKDAAFDEADLGEFAARLEIVWSRWDASTGTWSVPEALTDNAILDFKPRLAGPLADGDLLLTWSQSEGNQPTGTAAAPLRVLTARWDAATQTWGEPAVLVDQIAGELGDTLAAGGDRAVYVWSRDLDGDLENSADAELFYRNFDGVAWGPVTRRTTDSVADRNPRAWVDAAGRAFVVWNQADRLMLDRDFAGTPTVVREAADSLGVADFALTGGPGGNVVLIWQEMSNHGSDARYRVYDPASGLWSLDTLLTTDRDLERSFAPVWDAAGNLTVAYNAVAISSETVAVTVEGGEVIEVEGVPQPGQVDLRVAKRALVRDLEVVPDSLRVEGERFLPGDQATLRATVRNSGNVALQGVVMRFHDGDPDDGGPLIHGVTLPGWLLSGETAEIVHPWTLPEPAASRRVVAVVDPAGAITEFSEENNRASLLVGGVDLEMNYRSGTVLRDGAVRIVVGVVNRGAPASPVTDVRLEKSGADPAAAPLAVAVLGQIAPGAETTVILELPAGSHAEGETVYRAVADAEGLTGDVAAGNNETRFALMLWIDDDGDGMPRWWEVLHGLNDSDPDDAGRDDDNDGFTNLQEYLSGTNPRVAEDFLRVGEFHVVNRPVGGGVVVTFAWASAAGTSYDVERSSDLMEWETVVENASATPPLNVFEEERPAGLGQSFYRLRVRP